MIKLISFALVLTSFSVFADPKTDGCGLGWQVTKKKTLMGTSTRFTTNFVVPPTLGMTSGTLGCDRHSIVKKNMELIHFANANIENLSIEMAQGNGQFVEGFAKTMGCQDVNEFTSVMKANYSSIVTEGVNGKELLENVKSQAIANNLNCSVL